MAAPLIVVSLPAIFAALWAGLLALLKWALDHAHIVKIVVVCLLITAAFKLGRVVYITFMGLFDSYVKQIIEAGPSGINYTIELLAKANYCLPVTEMLYLLSVYIAFCGLCLALRLTISLYRSVPFKSA